MPFNSLVQEKILDFEQLGIPEVFSRDLQLLPIQKPERNNLAQVIVGARRCGKTYRLFQEMHDVIAAGYDPKTMLYFNFEDERLKPYSSDLLADVVDTFFAMRPAAKEEGCFLFFDEIQEVPDWSLFLRRVIDGLIVQDALDGTCLGVQGAFSFERALSVELLRVCPFKTRPICCRV